MGTYVMPPDHVQILNRLHESGFRIQVDFTGTGSDLREKSVPIFLRDFRKKTNPDFIIWLCPTLSVLEIDSNWKLIWIIFCKYGIVCNFFLFDFFWTYEPIKQALEGKFFISKKLLFFRFKLFGILRSDCAQQQGRIISVADPGESDPDPAFVNKTDPNSVLEKNSDQDSWKNKFDHN